MVLQSQNQTIYQNIQTTTCDSHKQAASDVAKSGTIIERRITYDRNFGSILIVPRTETYE